MVLNPAITGIALPFPLMPTLYFQVWEIPLVISFLLFGFKVAIPADFLNAVFLIAIFPGPSQPYYVTSALATFGTMFGVYVGYKLFTARGPAKTPKSKGTFISVTVALAIVFRTAVMAATMFCILYFDPLGVFPYMPASYILGVILPLQAIFNIIVPVYLVPTSYLVAKLVNRSIKTDGAHVI